MDNRSKADKKRQEDIALTHAMIWFAAAMVLEILLLLINRYYINFTADHASIVLAQRVEYAIRVLAVVATLAGIACAVLCWVRSKRHGQVQFTHVVCSVFLLALGLSCVSIALFLGAAVRLLYLVVPACAVLVLIYYLYQREFFLCALAIGLGILKLWMLRQNVGAHRALVALYQVVVTAILLAMILLALQIKKTGGVLKIKDKELPILPKNSNYMLLCISCLASIVAGAVATALGATAALYLIFALGAWLFILLVYYTVKMM